MNQEDLFKKLLLTAKNTALFSLPVKSMTGLALFTIMVKTAWN